MDQTDENPEFQGPPAFLEQDEFSKLPEEMILRVLQWVPRNTLGDVALVNRRLNRISKDHTLWKGVDASGRTLSKNHLNVLLSRKPVYVKFEFAKMANVELEINQSCNQLTHLDLFSAEVRPDTLAQLFSNAPNISHLSLTSLTVNDNVVNAMKTFAKSLKILNLVGVRDIPALPFTEFLFQTSNLQELNIWRIGNGWSEDNLSRVINSLPAALQKLSIIGTLPELKNSHIRTLTEKCKLLEHLHVLDCIKLTKRSGEYILCHLVNLQNLAVTFNCFGGELDHYRHLHAAKNLRSLHVLGISSTLMGTVQAMFPQIQIKPTEGFKLTIAIPRLPSSVCLDRSLIWNERVF